MLSTLRDHAPSLRRALRRRRRLLSVLVVAAAGALLLPGMLPAPTDALTIVVARSDLSAGQEITADDLTTQEIRTSSSARPLDDSAAVLGRRPALDIPAGSALHDWMLETPGQSIVPDGWVLIAAAVDPALEPFLRPGAQVGLSVPNATPSPEPSLGMDRSMTVIDGIVVAPPKEQVKDLQNLADGRPSAERVVVAVPADSARDLSHSPAHTTPSVLVVDYPSFGGNSP